MHTLFKHKVFLITIWLTASSILLSGCTTTTRAYEGPQKPIAEEAIIKGVGLWLDCAPYPIYAIDSKELVNIWTGAPYEVHVLPGAHDVLFSSNPINVNGVYIYGLGVRFKLDTAAGETYTLKCEEKGLIPVLSKFWIENTSSKIVAGPIYHSPQKGFTEENIFEKKH